jgi:DNA mismatch repair ATPase MutS
LDDLTRISPREILLPIDFSDLELAATIRRMFVVRVLPTPIFDEAASRAALADAVGSFVGGAAHAVPL